MVCGNARVENSELNFMEPDPEMVPLLSRMSFLRQFVDLMFKFVGCEWGHKQGVCSGCGSNCLFFHSRKEFGHVLYTFLIVG